MKQRLLPLSFLYVSVSFLLAIAGGARVAYAAPPGPARGLISASPVYPGRTLPPSAAGRSGAAEVERCTIPRGATVCSALVTWSTANVSSAVVTVQDTLGGGQVPFASGLAGSRAAQIQPPPHRYIFRLYDSSSGSPTVLADTTVLASGTGTITGFPNPCTILSGQTSCVSTISWTTQNVTAAQVTVQDVGGSESPFAAGVSGSQDAPILGSPHQYTFRLKDTSSGALLAATTVRATGSTLLLDGAPDPCQIVSGTSCLSRISWTTPSSVTSAVVTKQDAAGGGEVDFASGRSGAVDTAIQAPPHKYTFRLYNTTSGSRVWLASTVVLAIGTGTITPQYNPCPIPSGQNTCTTLINWSTQNVTSAVITVQDAVSGLEVDFGTGTSGSTQEVIDPAPQQYTFRLYDASSGSRLWLTGVVVVAMGNGAISANPNPCTIQSGQTSCTSGITWDSQKVTAAKVTKEDFGTLGTEQNFATGTSGSQQPTQVEADPHRYYFRLYDTSFTGNSFWLNATEVFAIGPGMIMADPNPCEIPSNPPGATTCTTTISWSTAGVEAAEVRVQDTSIPVGQPGFGEQLFASGLSSPGIPSFSIKAPPHAYAYRLYGFSSGTPFLIAQTVVEAKGTGTISASPNPCTITSGTSCTTTLTWNTEDVTFAEITVTDLSVVPPVEVPLASELSPNGNRLSGAIEASPHQYLFQLYDTSSATSFYWLASIEVSAISSVPAPAAPSNLTASAVSSSQINLAWTDNSSNEDGFKIERSPNGTTLFSEIATVGAGVNTYSNTAGLSPATPYYYRVRAFNSGGNSVYSNTANTTTLPLPPAPPSSLAATAVSSSQINLAWTDNSLNEAGFKIERCQGSSCSNFLQIATVGASVTTYSNTGLTASTLYSYRVRAFNSGGDSAYSNTASATTLLAGPPAAPSVLTAAAVSGTRINLAWTDNASNETQFVIERCRGASCTNFLQIASVGTNVTTYSDTTVARRKLYRYRVKARNSAGDSGYSNIAEATTP